MLAKKLRNRPRAAGVPHSFAARVAYVCRKATLARLANLAGDWKDAAWQMDATAGLNPRLQSPGCHIVLSWHVTERPRDAAMIAAAEELITALGGAQHQHVIAVHRDRDHPHVHIVLNRVHPVTGKVLSDRHDHARLELACRRIEQRHGRPADRGRFQPLVIDGTLQLAPHPASHWQRKREARRVGLRPDGQSQRAVERRKGFASLRDVLSAPQLTTLHHQLSTATSWQGVHDGLRPLGLLYAPHRSGARITRLIDGCRMAASQLGRAFGLSQLQRRLGALKIDRAGPALDEDAFADFRPAVPDEITQFLKRAGHQGEVRRRVRNAHLEAQAAERDEVTALLGKVARSPAGCALRSVMRERHAAGRQTLQDLLGRWQDDRPNALDLLARLDPTAALRRRYRHALRTPVIPGSGAVTPLALPDHTTARQAWMLLGDDTDADLPMRHIPMSHRGDIRIDDTGDLLIARRDRGEGVIGVERLTLTAEARMGQVAPGGKRGVGLIGPRDATRCIIVRDAFTGLSVSVAVPDALIVIIEDLRQATLSRHLQRLAADRRVMIATGADGAAWADAVEQILPHAQRRGWDAQNLSQPIEAGRPRPAETEDLPEPSLPGWAGP